LKQEIKDKEFNSHYQKGGVFVYGGYDHKQASLSNKMYLKWRVEIDFRRHDRERFGFEVLHVRVIDEEVIQQLFPNVKLHITNLESDIDDNTLAGHIDWDEVRGTTQGYVHLRVFRKIPWTEQEIKQLQLSTEPHVESNDDDDDSLFI
jgi:hypothetical protein